MSTPRKKLGTILLTPDGLVLEDAPPYGLPRPLTVQFADALLAAQPGEELFIGELFKMVTRGERERFQKFCLADVRLRPRIMALVPAWAAISHGAEGWRYADADVVYQVDVPYGGWAEEVILLRNGVKLIRTSMGLFTPSEYALYYGIPFGARMRKVHADAARSLIHINDVLTGDMVAARVLVIEDGRFSEVKLTGPVKVHPSQWRMPPGKTYVDLAI